MATVFLERWELAGGGRLPKVCVVCGRRGHMTDVPLRHRDSSFPFASGVTIATHQEAVLPLCREHDDYFSRLNKFYLLAFAGLAVLLLLAAGSLFLVGLGAFAVFFFLLFVAVTVVLGVTHFAVNQTRTRAVAIEDRGVWLARVSERFVDALEDLRSGTTTERLSAEPDWEDDRPRRRRGRRRRGVPLWAWAVSGAALVLLLAGGLTAYLLSGGALGWPHGAGGGNLTREKFEAVKLGMSDREVVDLLGTPVRARGTFGPIDHWSQLEASKTLSWEAGSTKVEVHLLGGGVHTIRGIFDDLADATPAAWTEANFRKLKWDLTCADVRALFGPPQEVYKGGTGLRGPNVTALKISRGIWSSVQKSVRLFMVSGCRNAA